jgi:cysteine-rich repeat protein
MFDATSGSLLFPCLADAEAGLGFDLTGRGTNFLVTKFTFDSPGGLAQLIDGSTGAVLQTYVTTDPQNSGFGSSATPLGSDRVAVGGFDATTERGFVEVFDAGTAELLQRIANPFAKTLLFGLATTSIGDSLVVSGVAPGSSGVVGVVAIYAPCGNGTVDAGETCDDGNQNDGDGCSATCQVVPALCGNGVVDAGEACDDGNTAPLDCCAENCQFEPTGTPCDDDDDICTNDVCNAGGACTHPFNTAPCDDGDACTVNDHCDAGTCGFDIPLTCDDGNVCTDDSCNPGTGCVFTNNTAPCNDGVLCTVNDVCSGGSCQGECVVGAACGPNCSASQTCQLVGGVCGCQ